MTNIVEDHQWPTDPKEHLWDRWYYEKGPPHPIQYRTCTHPDCTATERRELKQ